MARWHPSRCKACGLSAEECERVHGLSGPISARGYCRFCGRKIRLANIAQLEAHKGPFFDHWRERCRAAFGVFEDVA